jgi:hypothetical protein
MLITTKIMLISSRICISKKMCHKADYFLNWKLDTKWEFGTLFSSLTVLNDRQRSSDQQVVHHFFPDFQILSDFQIRWRWVFKKTWFFPTWTTELDDRQRLPGTMYRQTVGAKAKTLVRMSAHSNLSSLAAKPDICMGFEAQESRWLWLHCHHPPAIRVRI